MKLRIKMEFFSEQKILTNQLFFYTTPSPCFPEYCKVFIHEVLDASLTDLLQSDAHSPVSA